MIQAYDVSAHLFQGLHNTTHRAALYGSVAVNGGGKGLSGENARQKPGGGTAVSCVQPAGGLGKTVEPLAMDQKLFPLFLYGNPHLTEAVDGAETVSAL